MSPPAEPLRRLPIPVRPFHRETIGSFLTRLAYTNDLRVPHLLERTAIASREPREITLATDDHLGWSPSTPHRIAALTGRPLSNLAVVFPVTAEFLAPAPTPAPSAAKFLRACRYCAAARNITSMIIVRARPQDYLCIQHRLWHHGIGDVDLTAIPQLVGAQRRHNRRVRTLLPAAVAHAHQRARDIIGEWLTEPWQPVLIERWQRRLPLLHAAGARHPSPQLNVVTHPELLAVADLLLTAAHRHLNLENEAATRLGLPGRPQPGDPLTRRLTQPAEHPRRTKEASPAETKCRPASPAQPRGLGGGHGQHHQDPPRSHLH